MDEDLVSRVEEAASSRSPSLLDKWLEGQPEEVQASFRDSVKTFAEVMGPSFGWRRFTAYLQNKYEGYPLRRDGTQSWCKKNYPGLFSA